MKMTIDDGDHALTSQLFVLKHYTSLLKEGGILVIEDIQSERDVKILKESCPSDLKIEVIDLRTQKNRWDDVLFVVRKKGKF